jgi:hypothetical protein
MHKVSFHVEKYTSWLDLTQRQVPDNYRVTSGVSTLEWRWEWKKLGHWFWSIACTNLDHDMSKRLNKRQQREQEELELLKGQQEQVQDTQEEDESEEESDGGVVNPFAAVSRGWGLSVRGDELIDSSMPRKTICQRRKRKRRKKQN